VLATGHAKNGKVIMAAKKKAKKKNSGLKRAGVSGYNKPKRTPGHPTKSHALLWLE